MRRHHLGILHPSVVGRIDDDEVVRQLGHPAALGAGQCKEGQPLLFTPLHRFDAIGRVTAHAQAQDKVTWLGIIFQLTHKNVIVAKVIGDRRHPCHVIVEAQASERAPHADRAPFAQVTNKVGAVGGAPAVTENKNLAVLLVRLAKNFNPLNQALYRNRIYHRLKLADIILHPRSHFCYFLSVGNQRYILLPFRQLTFSKYTHTPCLSRTADFDSRESPLQVCFALRLKLWFNHLEVKKKGILLINTGSPAAPTVKEVRKYLAQFLMDPYVLDIPFWKRWLLVHALILRTRPKRSARLYRQIWTAEGSPLILISEGQRSSLAAETGLPVALGFRYGAPSIKEGLAALLEQGCDTVIGFPFFPQYSLATTESILVQLRAASREASHPHTLKIIPPFWNHRAYLDAWIESVKKNLPQEADHLLISFHGLPERHIQKADPTGQTCLKSPDCCKNASGELLQRCYRAQAYQMTQSLVHALNLPQDQYTLCYQSRLGREAWLTPYTHESTIKLARLGVRHLAVVAPSFISDCLETLHEIRIELKETFLASGGKEFIYLPCLNESTRWMSQIISELNP